MDSLAAKVAEVEEQHEKKITRIRNLRRKLKYSFYIDNH